MDLSISGDLARRPAAPAALSPALAWAAALLSSWWTDARDAVDGPPFDAAAVIGLLRRNGVPLLSLPLDRLPSEARHDAAFEAALAEDRGTLAQQSTAFAEIRAAWERAGIPALFVKALGPAPTFPYMSGNLDVLVPQHRQDEARRITRGLGYVDLRHLEEANKFLFRRYRAGKSAFDLHLHGRVEWHTEFVAPERLWQRAAFAPDTALALVPAVEEGLLIALAHAVYENKALKLIELGKFVWAARTQVVDWDAVADGARARGWEQGLWAALWLCARWEERLYGVSSLPANVFRLAAAGAPPRLKDRLDERLAVATSAPIRLGFVNSKRLFYQKMWRDPSLSFADRSREIYVHTLYGTHLRLGIRSQRPMLVALDGIDGSGKGAQATFLRQALEGAALRHRVVWTRGGSGRLLRPILALGKRLLRAGAATPPPSQGAPAALEAREAERSRMFRHPFVRRVWPWLVAAELGASYLWRVRLPLLRGEIVVADRYLVSALVELAARLERDDPRPLPAVRLLRGLAPRPDRAYWLETPAEVALARKDGQESLDFLARQARVGMILAPALGAQRIDARQPAEQISDALITELLTQYEDRHRTALNALFCANPGPLPPDAPRAEGAA